MFRNQRARHLSVISSVLVFILFLGSAGLGRAQAQNPFLGSVPTGQTTEAQLQLSLQDAFARALKYNLGAIEGSEDARAAHAARLHSLNTLLPDLTGRISGSIEQLDLKTLGFDLSIPGVHIPTIVGPFGVADARLYLSQDIFNWSDIQGLKSASQSEKASQYAYKSDRDVVVLMTGNAYLLVISDSAMVDSIRAQVTTAQTLYQQDADRNKQGVIASIDALRARVELQTQQQRLIAAQNQLNIDKLTLARIIGLPKGQEFQLADSIPYVPLDGMTLDEALQQAYATRPDYLGAKSQVQAAELAYNAASAENAPFLSTAANYGDIGTPNFGTSHGTLDFVFALNVPIFQGSRVRADKLQADSALERRKAELEDLNGRIDDQVRTAFYNLKSSSDLVDVAKSNIDLADQTLTQSRDRFAAGVADNLEVVQAQESVASANQSYIVSLYSFNLAKISLAQALGVAEQSALRYLMGGK